MIEISELTDTDVGRRVIWTVAPGVENEGQIAAWTEDKLLLAVKQPSKRCLRIVENVDPREVCWAERLTTGGNQ
jgi:hypothetical protein